MARAHKVKGPRTEGITDTVSRLGISVGETADTPTLLSPEAQKDAEKLDEAAGLDLGPLEGIENEEESGVVTNVSTLQPPKSSLRQALFEEKPKAPVVQTPPEPRAPESQSLPYQEVVPLSVPMTPNEPKPRKERPTVSPGVKRFGTLAKKLPGAERIRVFRRDPTSAALGHVNDYTARDLHGHDTIESFLNRYVKPHYGAGEYIIVAVDAAGGEQQLAPVLLLEPPKQTQENATLSLVRDLVEDLKAKNNQPAPAINPVSMLKDLNEVSKSMQPPPPPAPPPPPDFMGPLAAVIQASTQSTNTMMQMFMASMQQQAQMQAQQQQQTMQMFMQMMQGSGKSDPLPPMPPSTPGLLEGLTLDKIIALLPVVKELLGGKDDTKDILLMMLKQKDGERLSPKDTIELMNSMRPAASGTDDFRKALENLSLITQVAQNLRPQEQQGATFMDALGAFFSNSDFVSSVGAAIRKRAESAAIATEVKARKELSEQAMRMGYRANPTLPPQPADQRLTPPPAQRANGTPAPVNGTPAPVNGQAAPTNGAVFGGAAAQPAAQPAALQQQAVRFPPLPDRVANHLELILNTQDSAASVEETLKMLMYFAGFNEWRPFVEKMLEHAKQGDKRACLTLFSMLIRHMQSMNMLSQEQANRVFQPIEDHFDDIHDHVNGRTPAPPPDPSLDPFGAALHQAENPDDYEDEEYEEGDEYEEGEEEYEDEEGDDEEGVENEAPQPAPGPRALPNSN